MLRPLGRLLILVAALTSGRAATRVKRQHNLYSVNDFLGQLGQLAALSQGQGGGGPSNYLAGLLQGYQGSQGFQGLQGGRPGYTGYPQRPQRPVPPEYLQDLQYQQGQGVLGFDPAGGGFGLRPGRPGQAGGGFGYPGQTGSGLGGGAFYPGQAGGGLGGGLGGAGGLAGLAGLAGLGGLGGGGQFQRPHRPSAVSLANALQSVAQYDDAQCVPRLLCELTAGGRPGGAKQNEALPFVNRDTLVSLLTVLNFGSNSPLLVFGRAALLGYMAQGDPSSCFSAYPTCPRDPDRLVDYLNNHNGGFFRFFTGVGNPQYQQQLQYQQQMQYQQYQQQLQYQGYRPNQYAPQYRDYEASRVTFPRERGAQSRILTKIHPIEASPDSLYVRDQFLPTPRPTGSDSHRAGRKQNFFKFPNSNNNNIDNSNQDSAVNVVGGAEEAVYINGQPVPAHYLEGGDTFTLGDGEYTFTNPYQVTSTKEGHRVKAFSFPAIRVGSQADIDKENGEDRPYIPNIHLEKPVVPVMIFPTRTGTGDLRLDPAEHLKLSGYRGDQGHTSRPPSKPFRFGSEDHDEGGQQSGYQSGHQSGYQDGGYRGDRQGHAFRFPAAQQNYG